MKKRVLSLVCALVMSVSLMVVPTTASNSLFFLSLNDTLAPQSAQTTPIQHGGWVYVPVTVFSSRVTGINFGIYYGFTDNGGTLIFYNLSGKRVTFDLINGTAVTDTGESPVPAQVLKQNGTHYVPAYALCRHFGLTYSFHTTEYGPLLRIKDGGAALSDFLFISNYASAMQSRYQSYHGSPAPAPQEPTPPAVAPPTVTEAPPRFSMYLGLRASGDITAALNALDSVGAKAVVFFPANGVAASADQIRQAAGRGHKVGLIPVGNTGQENLDSVRKGAALLTRVLRQETWFVLSGRSELSGYLCWSPGYTAGGSSSTQVYDGIVNYGKNTSGGRVLLDSGTAGPVLNGVLRQLAQDGDTFLVPKETRY